MKKISLKIDNITIETGQGKTIFQAAMENGIEIPHLCYDPRLDPFTSCWLCSVEIKGFPRLVPSCTALAADGMEVMTKSEKVISAHKTCLELLLSDHYGDCIAPCQQACPDHIDIQGYLALAALGKYKEALALIREVNPLPLACGRVCPRFCEKECRRNLVDEPVGINYIKRFVTGHGYEGIDPFRAVPKDTEKRVAIIGSGPAGLTAAHFLRLKGHAVTIFDANPKPGGMLRYGIPEYRLPKEEMDREIGLITNMGVKTEYGVRFGRDMDLDSLRKQGYNAILLAIGAWSERKLGCTGEDLPGVVSGIGLLYKIAAGEMPAIGKKVTVIGGGNTAIDAARSCLRLGADEVHLIYRRSRAEMPANAEEVHEAEMEGVRLHFLSAPIEAEGGGACVKSIKCIEMELGEPDASGRRSPVPVEGSEFVFQTDMVVAAIGQVIGDQKALKEMGIDITRSGTVAADKESLHTNVDGVFAAGDCVTGAATVIEAIAGGRRASASIDRYLMEGMTVRPEKAHYNHTKGTLDTIDKTPFDSYEKIPRAKMPALDLKKRLKGFSEVELGLSEEVSKKEAGRCLSCGCDTVFDCKLRKYATDYGLASTDIIQGRYNNYKIRDEHPFIFRDRNKCVRCGLCVRMCSEIEGASAFGFVRRGFQTIIDPPLDIVLKESVCDSCGLCLSACPTGALTYRPGLEKTGPWLRDTKETMCTLCGMGCQIIVKTKAGYCLEVAPKLNGSINQGKLCWRGTFGWQMLNAPERIIQPYKRDGERMAETGWEEAINSACKALKGIIRESGPQSIAILVSPRLMNGEKALIHRFADELGIKDIYSPGQVQTAVYMIKEDNASDYSYVKESDFILCLGSRIVDDYPVASYMIKDAVRKGCRLAIVGTESKRLTDISDVWIDCQEQDQASILSMFSAIAVEQGLLSLKPDAIKGDIHALNAHDKDKLARFLKKGDILDIVRQLFQASHPVVILNTALISEAALSLLFEGIWENGNRKDTPIRFLPLQMYGQDHPAQGYPPVEHLEEGVGKGVTKAVLSFGNWKGIERLKARNPGLYIIQSAVFMPQNGFLPDFLFPASLPLESGGSFINTEGRTQGVSAIMPPPGGVRNMDFILRIAKAMDSPLPDDGAGEKVMPRKSECPKISRVEVKGGRKPLDPDWYMDEIEIYLNKAILMSIQGVHHEKGYIS